MEDSYPTDLDFEEHMGPISTGALNVVDYKNKALYTFDVYDNEIKGYDVRTNIGSDGSLPNNYGIKGLQEALNSIGLSDYKIHPRDVNTVILNPTEGRQGNITVYDFSKRIEYSLIFYYDKIVNIEVAPNHQIKPQ